MAVSLIMHKRITTTLAKAKALKKYVEPLITKSKEDTTNSRRVVFSYLQDKQAINELFTTIREKMDLRAATSSSPCTTPIPSLIARLRNTPIARTSRTRYSTISWSASAPSS
jgi:hypothetical protein